ncbi:MAG: hypothetical protein L0H70_00845 [Xanthomonadales bacterium]|nr:hypothetical protein [Xanthomonadales bacterium]
MSVQSTTAQLKQTLHETADQHTEPSRVRIHRAISWLGRAEAEAEDHDARFVFLWIAFNAAYAREFGAEDDTRRQLGEFFDKLLALDGEHRLAQIMLHQFSGPIRTLIDNKFTFEPFWRALRDHDASDRWELQFASSKKAALHAVMNRRSDVLLGVVFDRLYVLRNQLVHGGATWNSRVNRAQVKDGANILMSVVPVMLQLMLQHPEVDFGDVLYPVV